jgi:hypothetical protein
VFDRNDLAEPQDVVQYWAQVWSKNDNAHESSQLADTGVGLGGLGVDWYGAVLWAKLVSIRPPQRLLSDCRARLS